MRWGITILVGLLLVGCLNFSLLPKQSKLAFKFDSSTHYAVAVPIGMDSFEFNPETEIPMALRQNVWYLIVEQDSETIEINTNAFDNIDQYCRMGLEVAKSCGSLRE